MTVVYKYPLRSPVVSVEMPDGGAIRLVARDPASVNPAIWVEHDLRQPAVRRTFLVFGTGMEVEAESTHVGSLIAGDYVWHVYERHRTA
ncbi:MAG: hypothetical protein ABW043_17040 [Devosia sp.]|uniref:DUF7352 domain-containing protein n=1 Tax=Devosia sp. TaxID=1871048 RepID=UPI00339AA419